MSKVTQIQSALLSLGGGAFQKLVEHYLAKLGHSPLYPIGSVAGADKTKTGTPDALAIDADGRYTFFEHTTQKAGVAAKFADDLAKCLDEEKTGVALDKVARVVLCSTSDLTPPEIDGLRTTAQDADVKLDVVGLQDLSYDLLTKYPGIARDHLGVEVDTGQILAPDDFVRAYGANKLAAPLDTGFLSRDDEVGEVLGALESADLVVIEGPPGVGKSRLALEACARYAEGHIGCSVRCLFNRGADPYEDLRVLAAEPGCVVLLVDDANRLSSFEFVVQLVAEQRGDQTIKVVATVRDYAADRVHGAARPLGGHGHVQIGPFSDEQIKDLAREEFEILNGEYLDRIAALAHGNPRLAVMAARVATDAQDLRALHDATGLYEAYFASVRRDLQDRGDLVGEDLLRVAGIVGFFGVVDRRDPDQMSAIEQAFGLSPAEFWASVKSLHDLEVLDMYEREVVKPSDQILSTFLLYLAFFSERVLDVSALLAHFFPARAHRFVDSLNPVMSALDDRGAIEVLEPAVRDQMRQARADGDTDRVFRLIDHFTYLVPTEALSFAKDQVEATAPVGMDADEVSYDPKSGIDSPSVLSLLASFSAYDETRVRLALRLLLDYVVKRPDEMPRVAHVLVEIYGPRHDSHHYGYLAQKEAISELRSRAATEPVFFGRLLLTVAHAYLRCHFHTTSSYRTNSLLIYNFPMLPTDDAVELRTRTWEGVLSLYDHDDLREDVEALVRAYAMNARHAATDDLIAADAAVVVPFLNDRMETGRLLPCLAAHDALDFFEEHGIEVDPGLRARFSNPAFEVLDLFMTDRKELRDEGLSINEIHEQQRAEIREAFSDYDTTDYARLFETVGAEVMGVIDRNQEGYQVRQGLTLTLIDLAQKDADLVAAVLGDYLDRGDPLELQHVPMPEIVAALGRERTLEVLSRYDYDTKPTWLLSFYASLPADVLREEDAEAVVQLYAGADPQHLGRTLNVLVPFQQVRPQIIPEVVTALVARSGEGDTVERVLTSLFDIHGAIGRDLRAVFGDDVPLLRQAYAVVAAWQRPRDYKGRVVQQILDLDPDFIDDFVDSFYSDASHPRWTGDSLDHSYIWDRDDHQTIVERAVRRFAAVDHAVMMVTHSFLGSMFASREGQDPDGLTRKRRVATLAHLIERSSRDPNVMSVVSGLLPLFSGEKRRSLLATFLRVNRDFKAFSALELVPRMTTSWGEGGMVGAHLAKADYLDTLLPLLDDADLLEHKMHVEEAARSERRWAEHSKRRAFSEL